MRHIYTSQRKLLRHIFRLYRQIGFYGKHILPHLTTFVNIIIKICEGKKVTAQSGRKGKSGESVNIAGKTKF